MEIGADQAQGALDLSHALLTDMQVDGGGGEEGVAEELLDEGDLDAVLDEVGSEAMAQPVDTALGRELGATASAVIDVLCRALADGVLIRPLGEEPLSGPMDAVPGAEFGEEVVAEGNEALATALGMGDPELEALGVNVGDADMDGLGEAKPASIDGHEQSPGERIPVGAEGEETFDFVGTEDVGKWAGTPRGADPGEEDGDILMEEESVEGPEGLDGKSDGVVGELAILDEVEYVRGNLRTTEEIGRGVVKLGQIRDPMDIGLDGALGDLAEGEVIYEFLP
jgi:hypothetical protein